MKWINDQRTANIVAILTLIVTIGSACVAIFLQSSSAPAGASAQRTETTHWTRIDTYWLIIVAAIVVSNGAYALSRIRRNSTKEQDVANLRALLESYRVIGKLSALQGSYILTPKFVTAEEHGKHSKEGDLSKGGTAEILTNSLQYDLFFKDVISKNIIKGAKYIYILPYTNSVLKDLRNYITIIRAAIHKGISAQNPDGSVSELEELCKVNLEFWFFHHEIPCLYNFAIFRQHAEGRSQPFDSYCWYINPLDEKALHTHVVQRRLCNQVHEVER